MSIDVDVLSIGINVGYTKLASAEPSLSLIKSASHIMAEDWSLDGPGHARIRRDQPMGRCIGISSHVMLGILAYGLLKVHPGSEIAGVVDERIDLVRTPFPVEFARSSDWRGGAPIIVPVERGGAKVDGVLFVLKSGVQPEEARAMLRRRVAAELEEDESEPDQLGPNGLEIRRAPNLEGTFRCEGIFFARRRPNIDTRSPRRLAGLAIQSALGSAGTQGRDGISYLIDVKKAGISTPLMHPY